jgi:hypothetical protein
VHAPLTSDPGHPADGAAPPRPGRRWWQPSSDPDLPRITAKRAYTEVLFVFAAFFSVGIVGAALLLGNRYEDPFSGGSWALYGPAVLQVVMEIGLAVVVVVLLADRRGVKPATFGLQWPRLDDGRFAVSRTVRVVAWALFALIVGGVINAALQTGHLPLGQQSGPELIFGVFDSIQAGVIEELVVLAFVVVTLRQAGRPWWEVTAVALVLRGSYHIYYGPGVVGILVWAALYYWTYLRTRQLVPLMVCHAGWDMVGFLSGRWPGIAIGAMILVLAIWIAAPILWLVERNDKPAPIGVWVHPYQGHPGWGGAPWPGPGQTGVPPRGGNGAAWSGEARPGMPSPWPPPGWHPDPAGVNRWRWWDGHRWTEHVSHHSRAG